MNLPAYVFLAIYNVLSLLVSHLSIFSEGCCKCTTDWISEVALLLNTLFSIYTMYITLRGCGGKGTSWKSRILECFACPEHSVI